MPIIFYITLPPPMDIALILRIIWIKVGTVRVIEWKNTVIHGSLHPLYEAHFTNKEIEAQRY